MNAIEIHDLAKSFNGEPVLDEINFKDERKNVTMPHSTDPPSRSTGSRSSTDQSESSRR